MRFIRGNPVLEVLLGATCGGVLVLLVSWLQGARMPLEGPTYSRRTKDTLIPTLEEFTWQAQFPLPLDRESTQVFPFLLNHPNKCKVFGGAPFLLMLVMTQPQDQVLRDAIRHTWGNETIVPAVIIRRLFLIGLSSDFSYHHLLEEDEKHGDLLQVGFLDTYHNQTLKTLMGLEWVAQFCPMTYYVLKVNGNVFLNPRFLVQVILKPEQQRRPDFITGCIYRNRIPIRRQSHPQYMPLNMFSHARYPPYCCSPGYVLSGPLALKVLSIARRVPAVHLEDVFVGLCLHQLRVEPTPSPPNTFLMFGRLYNRCDFRGFALVHPFKHQELLLVWPDFQKANTPCPLE
ncbi:beta-1,3-galactosyltransferase 2-like [Dromiciops gliroides]|uniref:beta-1,3-galactosyltransferase 2-like n=1 Tax=Dromiciops gliroides TaxID=33562 RepID=UPI001CC59304|nr:beta-1,3-galactosyltransferase 2-like [Dromiciops gliroides]